MIAVTDGSDKMTKQKNADEVATQLGFPIGPKSGAVSEGMAKNIGEAIMGGDVAELLVKSLDLAKVPVNDETKKALAVGFVFGYPFGVFLTRQEAVYKKRFGDD